MYIVYRRCGEVPRVRFCVSVAIVRLLSRSAAVRRLAFIMQGKFFLAIFVLAFLALSNFSLMLWAQFVKFLLPFNLPHQLKLFNDIKSI